MARRPPTHPCPFTILIDTREQSPWTFSSLRTNADQGDRPIDVKTVRTCLHHGDYSILEHPDIGIERKSKADFYSSMSTGAKRANWEGRLAAMSTLAYAAVICESDWLDILTNPPVHTRFLPRSAIRTVVAWQIRYRNVHWWMMPGRDAAEAVCYRLMERFYLDRREANAKDIA